MARLPPAGCICWPHPQAWHDNGKTLFVPAEQHGENGVYAIELGNGDITALTQHGSHSQLFYEARREMLVGLRSSLRHPPEVFMLPCNDSKALDLPHQMSGFAGLPCITEKLEVKGDDGSPVQYWLLRPAGAQAPLPALLWIHGGPINAWLDSWHWRWNPLLAVAQGYAVILPNPRGSTGFGQNFVDGIWPNQWGAQCYRDLMAVVDAVAARPEIDVARIAAMGGSFGGYMTNWIGTQSARFACLVTHASVFDLSTFVVHIDEPAYWYLMMGGAPYEGRSEAARADYLRYSPAAHVANWRSPTLVIHGAQDFRVSVTESLALYEALQYHGVESEMLIFPDENHWILKPNNSIAWYQTVFNFLQRYLQVDRSNQHD